MSTAFIVLKKELVTPYEMNSRRTMKKIVNCQQRSTMKASHITDVPVFSGKNFDSHAAMIIRL